MIDQEKKDLHYMKQAFLEAEKALDKDEVPIGAVIVYRDKIIAKAHNLSEQLTDFTAHAEMQAFTMAADALQNKYLNKCTLYVTLEPCVMCAGAAFWTRVGRIVYGARDDRRGFGRLSDQVLHPTTAIVGGVMAEECGEIVREFFRGKR